MTNKDIEIVYEDVTKVTRKGDERTRKMPIGKNVPVLRVKSPRAFKQEHENVLRQDLKFVCKRHDRDGKLYFEVGESDDVIEQRIKEGINILAGVGVEAERSVEFTPHLSRATW